RQPSRASRPAVTRPTPRDPPATTAARPCKPRSTISHPPSGRQLTRERRRAQWLAGRLGNKVVPTDGGAGSEHLAHQQLSRRWSFHQPAEAVAERRVELRREEFPVEIVLVVDGCGRQVDLRCPVGFVSPV